MVRHTGVLRGCEGVDGSARRGGILGVECGARGGARTLEGPASELVAYVGDRGRAHRERRDAEPDEHDGELRVARRLAADADRLVVGRPCGTDAPDELDALPGHEGSR